MERYEHVAMNHDSSGISCTNRLEYLQVEFRGISLTGFRGCTSRSHYQSISKQTTRTSTLSSRYPWVDPLVLAGSWDLNTYV
ncbi:hypothetical protein Tco_1160980 [Tanacetum coccineum]